MSIHVLGYAYTLPGWKFLPGVWPVRSTLLFHGLLLPQREHDGVWSALSHWHFLPRWHELPCALSDRQLLSHPWQIFASDLSAGLFLP